MDQSGNQLLLRGSQPGAAERMRELLARTIQDHVSDERSTATVLEEIVQRLESLEIAVREVREREVPGLGAHLEGLAARVDDVRDHPPGWAESMAGRIETLSGQISPANELAAHELAAVRGDVGAVAEVVGQILPQLQVLCDTVTNVVDALKSSDDRLAGMAQDVEKLRHAMDAAGSRFGRLDKALGELTQRTTHLDKEMSAVKGRTDQGFSTLGSKVGQAAEALSGRMGAQETAVTELTTSVTNLGTRSGKLGDQVQTVHDRVEQLDDRIGDAEDRLGAIHNTVTVTENNVTALGGKFGALDERLDKSDERLAKSDERFGEQLAEQGRNLSELSGRVTSLTGKLGPVDGKLSAIDVKLSAVDARTGGLTGKLDGLDGRLEAVGARLDGLADKFVAVDGRFEAVGGRFSAIDARLAGLAEQIASVANRIDAVDRLLGDLPGSPDLEKARDQITEITAKCVSDLDKRIIDLTGKLADLSSRPERKEIEESVTSIVDAATGDVSVRLNSLEETVLTLAEALLRPAAAAAAARATTTATRSSGSTRGSGSSKR